VADLGLSAGGMMALAGAVVILVGLIVTRVLGMWGGPQ
jgi:hypothetical protein